MDFATFIDTERATIVAEWEAFARSLLPAAAPMPPSALRDHADEILTAIVRDMRTHQSDREQRAKSKGDGAEQQLQDVGTIHAGLRLESGFKLGQMVAEYRSLRASVLRLWEGKGNDPAGVTRFNEAIDEALTEAVERFMETSDHFRDQTLGILGHDLRNPLSAILTGSSVLLASETLDDRSLVIAGRMLNSARRMSRMIEELLDLTRTRLGDLIPIVRAEMDLEPSCRQICAELDGLCPPGALRFTAHGDLKGEWDADRIAQVLSNLVRNAIEHGGTEKPIGLVASAAGDAVEITVHNGGPPIAPKAIGSIFEPMVRHVGPGHLTAGLGLGLYIASQIVLAHGGKLDVTSSEGQGTTFSVHLPRRAASSDIARR